MTAETSWAQAEVGEAQLGDKRLTKRLVKLVEQFEAQPFASIPQACETWADTQAAYDFFDNNKVEVEAILEPHRAISMERMVGHDVVLAVQDTVCLNYTSHLATEGLGSIGTKAQNQKGLMIHTTAAITPDGTPLGLLDVQMWVREDPTLCYFCQVKPTSNRKERPIRAKESYKWLAALKQSRKGVPLDVRLVSVCDRESDIFEFFDLVRRLESEVVVRAAQDRKVEDEEGTGKLWEAVLARPIAGTIDVHIPARDKQPARDARLAVRFAEVKLLPPARLKQRRWKKWQPVPVWAVLTIEINPPEGVEPISWLLLTTVPVNTFQDACERLGWYAQRWKIEVYFDVLENGCKVEDRRLRTDKRLMRCIAVYMIVAIRLQMLTFLAREEPQASCLVVLSAEEWQTLYRFINKTKQLPEQPPSLRQALRWIAQMGGFLGRKCDGEPGIRTVWRGWQRLQDMVAFSHVLLNETYE